MKILQVMPIFEMAGAQTMCENLVNELIKDKNNKVQIISFFNKECEITKRLENKGIKIYYLNKKRGPDFKLIFKIKKILDEINPDVIHTHLYSLEYIIPAIKLSKIKNPKLIHTIHNIAKKEVPRWLQFFQKYWFKKGKVIPVAISEKIQETIKDLYEINLESIPLIYNGVDLEKCIEKKNYQLNNIVLHIGRFCEQKNHKELIDIFKECLKLNKDLKLYLVGEGELKSDIEKKVEELKLDNNIVFIGHLSECYKIMNKADIFVMPSKWEGMPMTIIEAMGTGLPIVASNVGGLPDMIRDGKEGYIVNSKSEFVDKINKVLCDIELRKEFGKKEIDRGKKYSANKMADEYLKLYLSN